MALINAISNIDDEWSNFLTNKYDDSSSEDDHNETQDTTLSKPGELTGKKEKPTNWKSENTFTKNMVDYSEINPTVLSELDVPIPTDIYISTKSKIAYLERPVDLNIFWDIPIISYSTPQNGIIKKQLKINSKSIEELEDVQQRLTKEILVDQHVISHIDNPNGRIKFKDIRKITIGISTKDIMSYRSKKKQAFYNCFVMIIRLKINDRFREFHVKVFNTGKLEMPGVQNDSMFQLLLDHIITILQPFYSEQLTYADKSDTVLINSNFNCGFYINREVLYDILRSKYNIQAIYDPCSYPGIQCKFYYNNDIGVQTGMQITTENKEKYKNVLEVSFMIFRTGSVLIVGMCEEFVLQDIYTFLKLLLKAEFKYICQKIITPDDLANKNKKKKIRRKTIHIITELTVENNKTYEEESYNLIINDKGNSNSNSLIETCINENIDIIPTLKPTKK